MKKPVTLTVKTKIEGIKDEGITAPPALYICNVGLNHLGVTFLQEQSVTPSSLDPCDWIMYF